MIPETLQSEGQDRFGIRTGTTLSFESPPAPDVLPLLTEGARFAANLYPAESNHFLPFEAMRAPEVRFVVARDRSGAAVGTGAIALAGDWAELKRMWVSPCACGRGISKAILDALERCALDNGITTVRLETGIYNEAALGLYECAGFDRRGPFADYLPDPYSVFMEKRLASA